MITLSLFGFGGKEEMRNKLIKNKQYLTDDKNMTINAGYIMKLC